MEEAFVPPVKKDRFKERRMPVYKNMRRNYLMA